MAIGCYALLLLVALGITSMAIGCSALLLLVAIGIRHYHQLLVPRSTTINSCH